MLFCCILYRHLRKCVCKRAAFLIEAFVLVEAQNDQMPVEFFSV